MGPSVESRQIDDASPAAGILPAVADGLHEHASTSSLQGTSTSRHARVDADESTTDFDVTGDATFPGPDLAAATVVHREPGDRTASFHVDPPGVGSMETAAYVAHGAAAHEGLDTTHKAAEMPTANSTSGDGLHASSRAVTTPDSSVEAGRSLDTTDHHRVVESPDPAHGPVSESASAAPDNHVISGIHVTETPQGRDVILNAETETSVATLASNSSPVHNDDPESP
jgi:hypothetical protein